jgi:phosphatidylinositol-3-phosphatase
MKQVRSVVRWSLGVAACVGAAAFAISCTDGSHPGVTSPPASATSGLSTTASLATGAIKHVFIVIVENEDIVTTFGPGTPATYLADTLTSMGAFLNQYYATGHASLDNYISMISGIAPDTATSDDCGVNTNFIDSGNAPFGQIKGDGCTYPHRVHTIADQIDQAHLKWHGYFEDMGNIPTREAKTCGHVPIGAVDITNDAQPTDQYAARHNPFVWFHSITDWQTCQNNVVSWDNLFTDLSSVATTPNYLYIVPNVCDDGHDAPCVTGQPGGLVQVNSTLKKLIPAILASPAYQQDGLIIITTDEGELANGSDACCNEMPGPNEALPGGNGPGGGQIGAVLISRFIKPGTISDTPYNHYSMLKSVEDLYGMGEHLGYAGAPGLVPFGPDVFTNPSGVVSTTASVAIHPLPASVFTRRGK